MNNLTKMEIRKPAHDVFEAFVVEWGREDGEPHLVTITFKNTDSDLAGTVVEVNEDGFDENDPELIPKLVGNKEGWVYMLTCLKGYLEFDVNRLRGALVK